MRNIRKKSFICFISMGLIAAAIFIGQYVIQMKETGLVVYENGVTRGEALKAIALALTDKEECMAVQDCYFSKEESGRWYVPYMNYLYKKGIIDTETIPPIRYAVEQYMETLQLKHILYRLNLVEIANRFLQAEDGQVVSEELWWKIYDEILLFYDRGYEVEAKNIKVCGTLSNISEAEPWKVYTNKGLMGFDGLALDYYIDSEIEVLQRNGEIIRVTRLLNRDITYENVWIMENGMDEIQVFLYGIVRSFSMSVEQDLNLKETIGDVTLQNGTVVQVTEKTQIIQEKVLAVYEDCIELEHYGVLSLSEEFQAYQLYDNMQMKSLEDILVGYASQKFIIENETICGALLMEPIEITQIRVLLTTTGYTSYYHNQVQVTCQNDFLLTDGSEIMWYPAGSTLDITADTFSSSHIVLKSEGEIGIPSISRAQGTPYYRGTLELTLTEQGILIVNELPLEDYLLKVVPSEMPARYGVETAKIQAICARSFAIGQIEKNGCRAYGAHVDDSTTYQVYNNIPAQENSTQGVRETEGLVLTDMQSEENVISAWYYSTSCGFGTDNRSWGSATVVPYIQAREISKAGVLDTSLEEFSNLQREDTFRQWITNWEAEAFEADMTWFRWKYYTTLEQFQAELQSTLPEVMASYGKYVLTVDEMGNERRAETSDFGTLLSVEVRLRGTGGIVQELLIRGTTQTLLIRYQTAIRQLLGSTTRIYENLASSGSSAAGTKLLPSAFFCLIPIKDGETITGYTISGGGNGHGIGMSQNAAKAMCDSGMAAEEVLKFFYPGAKITKLYG